MFSCEDPNYPENIWDEDDQGNASPSISSVEPEGSAFAGIDTLTINGQNFSENTSANLVYFNNMLGNVISATSTSLRVVTPNLVSDSVQIRVAVQGAFLFADHSSLYTLTAAVSDYGPFDQFTDIFSLDLDRDENLIVSMDGSPVSYTHLTLPTILLV